MTGKNGCVNIDVANVIVGVDMNFKDLIFSSQPKLVSEVAEVLTKPRPGKLDRRLSQCGRTCGHGNSGSVSQCGRRGVGLSDMCALLGVRKGGN